MYEEQTYESIIERLLDRVPDDMDKREGSIIYDAVAPVAMEIAMMYWELENVLVEGFADTASREYLEKRAKERNIIPYPATNAIVKATFSPATLEVTIGSRFNLGEFNYIVTEKISDGVYMLLSESQGSVVNTNLGEVTPIEYIEGLEYGEITEVLVLGEDEEDTEAFRERYLNSFNDQSSGGNIEWYKKTVGGIDGVGGVKVLRAWNGAGTVKCIIQNSEWGVPTTELVNSVQNIIDPSPQADGAGLAPIGHTVTIEGATADVIDILSTITLENDVVWEDIQAAVRNAIDKHFAELNKAWEANSNIIVRISQLEASLLSVAGIIDVMDTKLNGSAQNYTVASNKVAVRGTVTNG